MFMLTQFPRKTQQWFHKEAVFWPSAVATAIDGGVDDTDDLTNLVFFMHHKERMSGNRGKSLQLGEARFRELSEEWRGFRTMGTPLARGKGKKKAIPGLRHDHIKTVGAWCGSASLAHPERDVDFALEMNINRLDVVVNDHSKSRSPRRFTVRDDKKIKTLCKRAGDNAIEIHLMSWVMPHKTYIDRAAQLLVPLCEDVGASSLQWDAEEPWNKATDRMKYSDAANLLADKFSRLGCEWGSPPSDSPR